MICIFVGDVSDDLQKVATANDSTAQLITEKNNNNLSAGVYFTSLADCKDLSTFVNVLEQADQLVYVPPVQWSDTKKDFSYMKKWTEFYLIYFSDTKQVNWPSGILPTDELNIMLSVADTRKTSQSQLWVAGCSVSNGDGVSSDQKYGQLIANTLNSPVSFLTKPASSIMWAADQILRSDIQSGDIVVWGLTTHIRFPYYYNNQVHQVVANYYIKNPSFNQVVNIDRLDEKDLIYRSIVSIHQVVNHCQRIGAKLYIAGLLVTEEFMPYTVNLPRYMQLANRFGVESHNRFIDVGTDGIHPGPKMHQWYAEQILKKIKNA
jgi:hypothetical protein